MKHRAIGALCALIALGFGPEPPETLIRVSWTLYRPAWEAGEACEPGAVPRVVTGVPAVLEVQVRALADTVWTPAGSWPVVEGAGVAWVPVRGRAWVRARSVVSMDGLWTTTVPPRGPWRLEGCWSVPRLLTVPAALGGIPQDVPSRP